jgi:hypothetical protein
MAQNEGIKVASPSGITAGFFCLKSPYADYENQHYFARKFYNPQSVGLIHSFRNFSHCLISKQKY